MTSLRDTLDSDEYDEFGLLGDNAAEWDIPFTGQPVVSRESFTLPSGQALSYLRWGEGEPELVFLHGGAQNGHTWDTVMLALGHPAVAVDLPGHGHSDRRDDRDYGPWQNAEAVATLLEAVAPAARCVIGMSLGGATTIRLAAQRPDLCRRAVFVDVTPQINDPSRQLSTAERGTVSLIAGPPIYDSFDEMADAAVALSPFRGAAGVRRGVRHNARRLDDGRWTWRYDLFGTPSRPRCSRGCGTLGRLHLTLERRQCHHDPGTFRPRRFVPFRPRRGHRRDAATPPLAGRGRRRRGRACRAERQASRPGRPHPHLRLVTEVDRGRADRDALRTAWRVAGVYPDETVGGAIVTGCTSHAGDHIVFARVDGETTVVTLGELLRRAQASAGRLAAAGVRAGDAVVVQAPADLTGTEILAAVWLLHAVAVPLATTATADEVAHAIRETGAAVCSCRSGVARA